MTVQDEQTFFQKYDLEKLKHESEERIAQGKANAQIALAKIELKRERMSRWEKWDEGVRIFVGCLGIVAALFGVVVGIWWMWASSPADTPEEMKQDRFKSCVYHNGEDDGKHDNVWYPTAEGGARSVSASRAEAVIPRRVIGWGPFKLPGEDRLWQQAEEKARAMLAEVEAAEQRGGLSDGIVDTSATQVEEGNS